MVTLENVDYYRSLIHSLPFSMAVIDRDGRIIETNSKWDNFGEANDLDPDHFDQGVNYLDACGGVDDEHANRAIEGLKSVLDGDEANFKLEYPCHSNNRKRWFLMQVFPVDYEAEDLFIVTHLDITGRRLSERKSKRLSAIVDRIPVCIVMLQKVDSLGSNGKQSTFIITDFNPHAEEVTGLKTADVLGQPFHKVFAGMFGTDFTAELIEVTRSNVNFERDEVQSDDPAFEGRVWSLQAFNVTEDYLSIAFEDVTQEVKNRDRLEYLATYDELTGIPNRDHLLDSFRRELERARRYDSPLSLILLDLDRFKDVNDTYGHVYGDDILEGIGGILNDHSRSSDLSGRYGGEEFAIVLPETEVSEACVLAQRVREDIEEFKVTTDDGKIVSVTCSIGVSERKESDKTIKDLLCRADEALYEAKDAGRNRVVLWAGDVTGSRPMNDRDHTTKDSRGVPN